MVLADTEANPDTEFSLPEIKLKFSWKKHFKSVWLTFASIGLLTAIVAQSQVASATYNGYGRYYVSTNGSPLNIRSYPSESAPIVGTIYNGTPIRVGEYRNNYARLRGSGGWIYTSWINSRYTPGSINNPGPGVGGEYNLSIGSSGRLVARLQRRLGIYSSGYYDSPTANAVRRYQTSVGLTPDGVAGPATINSLFSSDTGNTSGPGVGGEYTLNIGSQGRLVAQLQRRLGIRATGYYDYTTADAVRRYQRSVGIYPADGVVGPQTANSLFS